MPEAQGETICCTEPQMDALIALLQFLNAERDLPLERFTAICDVIVDKITRQGGVKCDLKKIPDICYEGQVALMLSAFMPAFTNIEGDDHNRPDLIFKVRFINSNKPTEVAIECKNIRSTTHSFTNLLTLWPKQFELRLPSMTSAKMATTI